MPLLPCSGRRTLREPCPEQCVVQSSCPRPLRPLLLEQAAWGRSVPVAQAIRVLQSEGGDLLGLIVDPRMSLRLFSICCQQFVAEAVEHLQLVLPCLSEETILSTYSAKVEYN